MTTPRRCTQCQELKLYTKAGGQNKKASGFMGTVCWDCYKVKACTSAAKYYATPEGKERAKANNIKACSTEAGRTARNAASAKAHAAPAGLAKARAASLAWAKKYPEKNTANRMKYHASKLKRIPPWANLEAIKQVYTEATKQGLHVDHIYPLQGRLVSGLHVENNLQLLTQSENSSKGNRMPKEA